MAEKPLIAITIGDPAGIGPEVVAKSLASGEVYPVCRPVVIGSAHAVEQAIRLAGAGLAVRKVEGVSGAGEDPGVVDVLDPGDLRPEAIVMGQASAECGRATAEWRRIAAQLLREGRVQATVSAPVNTEALKLAGVASGGAQSPHTFNFNGPLRIVRFTDHTPLREVPDLVKKDALVACLQMIHDALTRWGFPDARIAVAGLNPHAMGEEEEREIAPAVEEARRRGVNAVGPMSPDTVFRACADGEYDLVLAMTHDQANIAQKTRQLEGTVSIADPSDPLIRIGVSHGTAYDIAGKGMARHESVLEAIKVAASFAAGRGFPH